MKISAFSLLLIAILSGCVTRHGISLPLGHASKEELDDLMTRNAASHPAGALVPSQQVKTTTLIPKTNGPLIIVIGNVMSYEKLDETGRKEAEKSFEQAASKAKVTKEWLFATLAGETLVKYEGIPGIYHRAFIAEVPKDLAQQINFSSILGEFMYGGSGDLVVVQFIEGTGNWITHILCNENDANYSICENQYKRGMYQGIDGREINARFQIKDGGTVIDTKTFKEKRER